MVEAERCYVGGIEACGWCWRGRGQQDEGCGQQDEWCGQQDEGCGQQHEGCGQQDEFLVVDDSPLHLLEMSL